MVTRRETKSNVIFELQQDKKLTMNIVLVDSTTMKVHRHGGGLPVRAAEQKGGSKAREKTVQV